MRHLKLIGLVLFVVIAWIASLQLLVYTATYRLHISPDTAYSDAKPRTDALSHPSPLVQNWERFDSFWYLSIANHGYFYQEHVQSSIVFFPAYPALVSIVAPLTHGDTALAGIGISILCTILCCILLYKLAELEFGEHTAWRTIALLLAFPTSFFLISIYTESLFLLLAVLTFYLARSKRWWLAGLTGIFLAATRVTGLAIILPLLWEYARQYSYNWKALLAPKVLSIAIIPLGLLMFMGYLQGAYGDPLLFLKGQEAWQRNHDLSQSGVVSAFQTYFDEFKTVAAANPHDGTPLATRYIDVAFTIVFIVSVIAAWFFIPRSYALFATILLIIPLLSGRLQSIPRYMLTAFPLFFLYAKLSKHETVFPVMLVVFTLFLSLFAIMFTQFYWVG